MRAPHTTAPSATLVELATHGDQAAFGALVTRYDHRLRGLAYSLLAGDAPGMDDVLQEAYLKAFVALPRYRGNADPGTWLYRIVYNACIDELRRRRRRPRPVDIEVEHADHRAPGTGPADQASAADATVRALRALSDAHRAVVVLVDGHGFDTRAAAQVLGISEGTVRSRLSRARSKARHVLEGDPS